MQIIIVTVVGQNYNNTCLVTVRNIALPVNAVAKMISLSFMTAVVTCFVINGRS